MIQTGVEWFDKEIELCMDVRVERMQAEEASLTMAYTEQMIDNQIFTEQLLPEIRQSLRSRGPGEAAPLGALPLQTEKDSEKKEVLVKLFSGSVLLFIGRMIYEYPISAVPGRQPEESSSEISIKGPRDGFVEEAAVNIALVRKRLKTSDLKVEHFTVGSESQTQVALMYLATAAKSELVEEARRRIEKVNTKILMGSGQWEEMIADRSNSLLPLVDYTGRPDFVIRSLLVGRITFVVDGLPLVYTAPTNLFNLLKSPEDSHNSYYFVSLERIMRVLGLAGTLALPGFWVALSSYSVDQIPFPLLATIVVARSGLPMSSTMEMFFMLVMFELFREAGIRLPRAVGQTVAVVGGIIVGDAAIRAGLTSPTMLVVSAITNVASFTLVNQTLLGSVSLMRLWVLLASSVLGMFGFFISMFAVLLYMASLSSFGRPFLSPIGPIDKKMVLFAFLRYPTKYLKNPLGPKTKR